MLESIKKMLEAFEKNEIIYCHWKSNEHLDEALTGDTDLDILFLPEQRNDLEKVLIECGLRRFRATPLMQYNAIEDYIGFDEKTAKIWHLHTHYRMTLGEKHLKGYTVTPWHNYILRNRRSTESGIYCSAVEDELVLLIVRIALKLRWRDFGKTLGKDDCIELEWLLGRVEQSEIGKTANEMLGEKSGTLLLKMIQTPLKKKNQFWKLHRVLIKDMKPYTGYSRLGSWFMRTKREVFWLIGGVKRRLGCDSTRANRRISPSGGYVVAFLGCDGAGKSTTLKYVKKEFKKKIDVIEIYFGSGDGSSSLLRKPMKLVAKRVGGKGVGHAVEKEYASTTKEKRVSLKAHMYSIAKIVWAITLANEKKGKLRQMVKARNNGLLVVTDRYPQSDMPGCSDGPLLSKYQNSKGILKMISNWEQKIYESASINPPDLAIKLVVPTELAIERKPEMTFAEIEQKKDIVMNMSVCGDEIVIDSSKTIEQTRGEVMKAIWERI